jgi:prepilin-type N-terminal cleavage/methylation domain-containing protein
MTLRIGKKIHRNSGFTLVELILVILLISILTGLSTPLFRKTLSGLVLKNASFDLAQFINYAREMAIVEKTPHKLNLDFENGKYWITRYAVSEEGVLYKRVKGRYGREYFLPRGLGFTADKKEFIFYPDGRSDEAEIKITDKKTEEARLVSVEGFGEGVKIKEAGR